MSTPPLSTQGLLGWNAPIQDLERLWLEASCYYAVFDDNILEDTEWDHLGRELWERRTELSPYFCHANSLGWPMTGDDEGGREDSPLKSAMGIKWEEGLPAIIVEGIRKEGPKRIALWRKRLEDLRAWHRKVSHTSNTLAGYRSLAEARREKRRKKRLTNTSPPATTPETSPRDR